MNTLLFIGHPGHELLAYKFLQEYKPYVIFLTTGSGNADTPRIKGSIDLVEALELHVFSPFSPFTDRQIYNLIMDGNFGEFKQVKSALTAFVLEHNIERIVGDALEGFNPSHDLCRYIINGCVQDLKGRHNLENYDFLQDEVFRNSEIKLNELDIVLRLNNDEMEAKLQACRKYSELKFEVDRFFDAYGSDFFALEYFRHITDTSMMTNWEGEHPFYELHGRKRVQEGIYEKALLFEDHMLPLAKSLLVNST
ncbi:MAG: hypothetical protein HEP71_17210 [Roseivirga sp.]|nr:hypothetical protein [Roseivirga sp.]